MYDIFIQSAEECYLYFSLPFSVFLQKVNRGKGSNEGINVKLGEERRRTKCFED